MGFICWARLEPCYQIGDANESPGKDLEENSCVAKHTDICLRISLALWGDNTLPSKTLTAGRRGLSTENLTAFQPDDEEGLIRSTPV